MGEDGYCPLAFIEGKQQIKDISTVLLKGIAPCSNMKKGRMTLACLSETKEGYKMHIVTGEGKNGPNGWRWAFRCIGAQYYLLSGCSCAPGSGSCPVAAFRRRVRDLCQ
jgi:hypothetical protein